MKELEQQLEAIGLNEKEAKAYLASLELGPATAQQIAAKAVVVRPTAYVAIGGLVKRGLMSSFIKGKKQYFQAERPEQLLRIIEKDREKIIHIEKTAKQFIPQLESILNLSSNKLDVRYYEGVDGLDAMRERFFLEEDSQMDVLISYDDLTEILNDQKWRAHNKNLEKRKIKGRTLFTKKGPPYPQAKNTKYTWQYKRLDLKRYSFSGELAIFGNCISLVTYEDKQISGVIVVNKKLSRLAKVLFELAWQAR